MSIEMPLVGDAAGRAPVGARPIRRVFGLWKQEGGAGTAGI